MIPLNTYKTFTTTAPTVTMMMALSEELVEDIALSFTER